MLTWQSVVALSCTRPMQCTCRMWYLPYPLHSDCCYLRALTDVHDDSNRTVLLSETSTACRGAIDADVQHGHELGALSSGVGLG